VARTYRRDARGRFASGGYSGQSGGRGARLKAKGSRDGGGAKMTAARTGGTVSKPKGLKPDPTAARRNQPLAITAKPKRSRKITDEKVGRLTERINNVTRNAANKAGVKRANATEVGVRAKSFVTRKVGGMSGLQGKTYAEQTKTVREAISKPPKYSTQKPNRNKPLRFNSLGQDSMRAKQAKEARTAQQKISDFRRLQQPRQGRSSRLMGRRELTGGTSTSPVKASAKRLLSTIPKTTKKSAASSIIRNRSQAKTAQRGRREATLNKTRPIIGNNSRVKRQQTGMTQLNMLGKSKELFRYRPVSSRRR
jgi:hypothetical protein